MLLIALICDFPKGFCAWFSLVPLPSRLAWAVVAGAIVDALLAGGWEFFLRAQVRKTIGKSTTLQYENHASHGAPRRGACCL